MFVVGKNGMFYNKKRTTKVVVLMWCFQKILAGMLGQEEAVRSPEVAFSLETFI